MHWHFQDAHSLVSACSLRCLRFCNLHGSSGPRHKEVKNSQKDSARGHQMKLPQGTHTPPSSTFLDEEPYSVHSLFKGNTFICSCCPSCRSSSSAFFPAGATHPNTHRQVHNADGTAGTHAVVTLNPVLVGF